MNYPDKLNQQDLSESTKRTYLTAYNQFVERFKEFTKPNLLKFKKWCMENFAPRSVNVKINAINYYLKLNNKKHRLKGIKQQYVTFTENVISTADYEYLKKRLKKDDLQGYFLIRFLGATGARVSEFVQLKIEHVKLGYFDIYGKGNKYRRIYIPSRLQKQALTCITADTGYLFTENGRRLTPSKINKKLKQYAIKYHINPQVMYAHSFRHRFAKSFISKYNDITLLSDLLGHTSLETTKIYLRKSLDEQREIVNRIVTW